MVAVGETGWHLLSWSTCTCLAFPHCSCQHHHHHLHHHHHDHHQVAASAPSASAALLTGLAVPHRGWHHQHGYQQHQYRQQANSLVLLPYCIDEFISNLLCLSFSCIVDLPGHAEYNVPIKRQNLLIISSSQNIYLTPETICFKVCDCFITFLLFF